jgi:hypothetical protein
MENEKEVYLSWKSPSRLFKKRDKNFFQTVFAIGALLFVILFFAKEVALIFALLSVFFLIYVFSTIPPEEIQHSISNRGIESAGKEYVWDDLQSFWFEEQWGQHFMTIVQKSGGHLVILLGDISTDRMKDILTRFIRFDEVPQKTVVDNAASWLSKKIPLEKNDAS